MRKKPVKLVKQQKIITYQPKNFENQNIVDIKSLLQNIGKLQINYPRPQGKLKTQNKTQNT